MKKTIFLIFIAALTISTRAQISAKLGIKAGTNISGMTSEDYSETYRKPGFYAGILSEFSLSENFSVQSELLYATYGAEVYQRMIGISPVDTYYSLDYIQFPIAAKFYLNHNLSFEIGPAFNLLVRDKCYRPGLPDLYDSDGNFLRSQSDVDPSGSRFEFSGIVGVTYKLCSSWAASVRYTQGLSSAFNYNGNRPVDKNNAFQIGLEYFF
jgi:hypothetical protein